MKQITLLLTLLWPLCLFAALDVDSLMQQYEHGNAIAQNNLRQTLVHHFSEEEYYDYPVNEKALNDHKFSSALLYLGMANYEYDQNRFPESKTYAEKALTFFNQDSLRWRASCYAILNTTLQRIGDFNKALEYAQQALSLGNKLHDNKVISSALNSLATINLSTEHFEEALHYINQAIDIERQNTQDNRALAIRLGIKCETLMCMHRPEEALQCINEALEMDRQANRMEKVGIRLSQKADILLELEQWSECRKICLEAQDIFRQNNQTVDLIITLKQLGMCEMGDHHYSKAEQYLLEGERLCLEIGFKPLLWRMQNQLYQLYKKTDQLDKAMTYLEKSTSVKDSLNNERYQQLLSEYQVIYQTHEKEDQIAQQQQILKNRYIILLLLAILLTLLIFLALITLKIARNRKNRTKHLEESNHIKDQIFSIISHDLKNPVQAQKQVLDYMCEHFDDISIQDKRMQISALKQSNDILNSLLINLLDWTSLEFGKLSYKPIRIDLVSLVRETLRKVNTAAKNKHVTITTSIPTNTFVMMDINYLEIILFNLLSNAVKFSYENSNVEIESEESDGKVVLKVIDHGVGMDEDEKKLIFQKEKISKHGTSGEVGTGIGLLLCKELIDKSHNQISFHSELNHGTTVTFSMQKAQ